MADKIQEAYQASKNIYDDVLTQGSFFSKMYIKLFWSGTDDNEIARKIHCLFLYKGKIRDHRLAGKDYTFKERLVYAAFSDRRTA